MKLLGKLYIQVLIAMVLAIALGLLAPSIAVKMQPLGTADAGPRKWKKWPRQRPTWASHPT